MVILAPLSINLSFVMLIQLRGRFYRPLSLLSEDFKAKMYIASFTSLSNICAPLTVYLCFPTCRCAWRCPMCFETSDVVKLGFLCSPHLAFSDCSVSLTCVAFFTTNFIHWTNNFILLDWIFWVYQQLLAECLLA